MTVECAVALTNMKVFCTGVWQARPWKYCPHIVLFAIWWEPYSALHLNGLTWSLTVRTVWPSVPASSITRTHWTAPSKLAVTDEMECDQLSPERLQSGPQTTELLSQGLRTVKSQKETTCDRKQTIFHCKNVPTWLSWIYAFQSRQ